MQNLVKIKNQEQQPKLKDFDVALKIYELTAVKGEYAYYRKLIAEFENLGIGRVEVSRNIDKLFDLGIVEGDWVLIKDLQNEQNLKSGSWVRIFKITDNALPLIESQYNLRKAGIKDKEQIITRIK